MKNRIKLFGVITLMAVIGFSFAALSLTGCGGGDDGDIDLTGNITINPNTGVTTGTELTAAYTGTETVSYQWKRGSTVVGADSNKYTPDQAGSYTVTVSAKGYKSKTSAAVTVTGDALRDLTGDVTISPTSADINTELTATYSGSEAVSFQWEKDGSDVGEASTANPNKYTPTEAGSYTVKVSAAGYKSKTATVVDVNDPSLSTLSGTVTISPTTATVNTELTATYSGSEAVSFQWIKDGSNIGTASTTKPNKFTPTTAGSYAVTVRLEGYNPKTSAAVTVTGGTGLVITTEELPNGETGTPYNETLTSTEDEPITWTIESGELPAGLSLAPATGVISGMPITEGLYIFTVKAANASGSGTKELSITITSAGGSTGLVITTVILPNGTIGTPYSERLTSTGSVLTYWTVVDGALPAGLSISIIGEISGTPTTTGTYTFTVQAGGVVIDTKELSITITNTGGGTAPVITTEELPNGPATTPYSQTLAATGDTPIIWTVATGALPPGLSLATTGVISGTPTTTGLYTFTVKATNAAGSRTKQLSITITSPGGGIAPVINTTSLDRGEAGTPYSQTLTTIIGDTPITWTVVMGSLPAGLSLDPATGEISGTPTIADYSIFTVKAANATGIGTKELAIAILSPGGGIAPVITTASLPNGTVGTPYSQTLTATGDKPILWTVATGALPPGLSLEAFSITGIISGTPTTAGTYTFTVMALNPIPPSDTKELSITVTVGATHVAVTGVTLDQSSLSLAVGGTATLTPTIAPANATNKAVTWSSSDPTKATVVNGVVTAVAAGSATITVTTVDGNKTATCSVTVTGAAGPTQTFDSITAFEAWLKTLSTNTATYSVKLNVDSLGGSASTTGSVGKILGPYSYIRINLDLSGSTFAAIEDSALGGCACLTSVTIGNSVTSIGNYAFNNCSELTSITIPNNVTSIGEWAFSSCKKLASVTFTPTSKVTSIGYAAFDSCTSLTGITIPNSVTSMGLFAFNDCTSLASVTFTPTSKVTSIGAQAFRSCTSLTSVTIPNSVTSIGNLAFSGCNKLTSVTFQGTITSANFSSTSPFPGDLRTKYLADGGGVGTYTTTTPVSSSSVWTKQ